MEALQNVLRKSYYDPENGLTSAQKLYKKLKPKHPKVTLKLINDFINNQAVAQVHHKKVKPEYNQILALGFGELQIDLLDLSEYKSHNDGFRYILVAVDVYSRMVFCRPMKKKDSIT